MTPAQATAVERVSLSNSALVNGHPFPYRFGWKIGVLANLVHSHEFQPRLRDRKFITVDIDNFNEVMRRLSPQLNLRLETPSEILKFELKFRSREDFGPANIVASNPHTTQLLKIHGWLSEQLFRAARQDCAKARTRTLQQPLRGEAKTTSELWSEELTRKSLDLLRSQVRENEQPPSLEIAKAEALLLAIEAFLQEQVDAVLQDPSYRSMEASWRGLFELALAQGNSRDIQVQVLPVTYQELREDLSHVDSQSAICRMIKGESTYQGSEPFSLLVGDFEMQIEHPDALQCLKNIAEFAAQMHVPFVAGVSPSAFGVNEFSEIPRIRDLAKRFDMTEMESWREFRCSPDSRYIGLCVPHIHMRRDAVHRITRVGSWKYESKLPTTETLLPTNAAYGAAASLMRSFIRTGWFADCAGRENGQLCPDEISQYARGPESQPTDCPFTDRRAVELHNLGMMATGHDFDGNTPFFWNCRSVHKSPPLRTIEATTAARLASQLPRILSASQFVHLARMLVTVQPLLEGQPLADELNAWLAQFVTDLPAEAEATPARPLRAATVEVRGEPGKKQWVELRLTPAYRFVEGVDLSFQFSRSAGKT